jgi:diguanylate cyclase (GGDEF)-like protein
VPNGRVLARVAPWASVTAATLALCLSSLVLTGWVGGWTDLTRMSSTLPPVAPVTAVAVAVAALGVLGLRLRSPLDTVAGLAVGSLLVGGSTAMLVSLVAAPDDALDRLLFADRLAPLPAGAGSPAPESAIALLLVGVALPLLVTPRPAAALAADLLAVVAALVALAGVVAFPAHDIALFPASSGSTTGGIAAPTAAALLLVAVGVVTARHDSGLLALAASPSAGGLLMRHLLPTLGLAPLLGTAVAFALGGDAELSRATAYGLLGVVNVLVIVLVLVVAAQRLDRMESERREAVAVAAHRAAFDPLTGLANRKHFLERLETAVRRDRPRPLAVIAVDLDHLRAVNDSRGNEVGDRLLVAVAERMMRAVRPSDLVARVGGDEFAVLCEDVDDPGEAGRLADRLAAVVRAPLRADGGELTMTAAVGVAYWDSSDGADTSADPMHAAEIALSRAKLEGPDQVGRFDDRLRAEVGERYVLEQELRRALEADDQLVLHYQPIVDLRTGRASSVEALLRWQHPSRGLLPPTMLLDVAAEAGLLTRIGDRVLAQAAAQAAAWQHLGLRVYVNLSGVDVGRPDLAQRVLGAAAAAGCPTRALGIEVTEQHVLTDLETAHIGISALRRAGVGIAVDDFGTGYSSLTYLRRLSVDRLKVDGSLVRGLATDPVVRALVSAAVQMGHALGLSVVGEAVEDAYHESTLVEIGADAGQGYLYAPPLSPTEAHRWLLSNERR